MTTAHRRTLGPGPQTAPIQAAQADLLGGLPGVRLPDLDELRDRGVLGQHQPPARPVRRALGAGPADAGTESLA
ncbi:hypothetical protein ACH4ZU_36850 [Streptomyces sp. NPDC020472]|uniref:hypothetical protein n=1 Tax=Streptomyces sp. NPDC020472 TaxID=3365075 RepID=UPI00379C4216